MRCPQFVIKAAFIGAVIACRSHSIAADPTPPIVVPELTGRAPAEAKQSPESAGLVVQFQVGRAAPRAADRCRLISPASTSR